MFGLLICAIAVALVSTVSAVGLRRAPDARPDVEVPTPTGRVG